MLIVSTFEHTLQLEQALAVLEQRGIHKASILVVPMDQYDKNPNRFIIRAEDIKVRAFEVGTALATGCGCYWRKRRVYIQMGSDCVGADLCFYRFVHRVRCGLPEQNTERRAPYRSFSSKTSA